MEEARVPSRTRAMWGLSRALAVAASVAMPFALYMIFVYAPEERTMGIVQRIFYVHAALAWNAYLAFTIVLVAGIAYLLGRHARWDALAVSAAELGVVFTSMTLVTGMLWARPVWNTWWTWDPRLTTTLILWFMYVGYLLVRAAVDDEERRARVSAVFGIVAFLNVPMVHFSARWWRGLHPIIIETGPRPALHMDERMAVALLVMVVAMTIVHGYLLVQRVGLEMLGSRVRAVRRRLRPVTD